MRKNPVDSGQRDQPERASRQRLGGQGCAHRLHVRITPGRVVIGTLAFVCLVLSAIAFLLGSGTSYASVARSFIPGTPGTTPVGTTPTSVGTTPTPVGTTPVVPTKTPTIAPTAKPTVKPTAKPTAKPTVPPVYVPPPAAPTATTPPTAVPTATPTADNSTPVPVTPTATPTPVPVPTLTAATPTPGSAPRVALIVGGVFLVLLVGLGAGWFYFRRMLMPQGAADPNLPPSGARPWARNSDGSGGMDNAQGATMMMNGGFDNNGYGPGGYGSPDMNGNGYGGYQDGFMPPSPQTFPQGDTSMLPPGSGAFPMTANGVAPAGQAFNAMYGMPEGPYPGYNGNDYGGPPPNGGYGGPPNGGNVAPGPVDLNDPYLADVIRQYSQIGQGGPPQQQQMPPNQQGPGPGYQQGPGPGYQQGPGPGYQQGPGQGPQGPQSNWLQ